MGSLVVDVDGACVFEWVNCVSGFVSACQAPLFAVGRAVMWRKGEMNTACAVGRCG